MMKSVDKTAIAAAFGRAALDYDRFAQLQRLCGEHLLARVEDRPAGKVLDAGCGTGWFSRLWRERGSSVIALDLSLEMLNFCQVQRVAHGFIEGDIEAIPLGCAEVDIAWSNLAVQWCGDLRQGLSELYRVTKPGGCVAFTTLAAGSLTELRQAWLSVDEQPHANQFLTITEIEQACSAWQTELTVWPVTQLFPDVLSALRSLKGVGATHLHGGRKNALMTRRQLQQLSSAWPQRKGGFPLSWQLISGVIERD